MFGEVLIMVEVEIKREGEFQYIEKGQGPTMLVLHGLFGALSNFTGVFRDFTSRFKVIIPILPIYSMPVLDTTVKSLARFVHRFIEFKNLKNISLLGNSLGGHVALV
ncbi:MAG: alpha/beta fold hydrolase, partial [Flavobacteriales bacterium]